MHRKNHKLRHECLPDPNSSNFEDTISQFQFKNNKCHVHWSAGVDTEGDLEILQKNIPSQKDFKKPIKTALRPQSRSKSLLSLHSESPKCKQYFRNLKTIEKDIQTEGKSFIHFKRTSHKPRCVLSSRFDVGKNLKYSDSIITSKILSKEIVKQPVFKKPLILIEDQSEYFIEEDESISEQCTNKFVTFADVKQY